MPTSRSTTVLAVLALAAAALGASAQQPTQAGVTPLAPASIKNITAQFRKHGLASPPAKPDGAVRVATYNIHELYDDADDPALSGRSEDIGRVMIESRRVATGAALASIDADIVALQEVESLDALRWYRDGSLAAMGYDHLASEDVGHSIGLEQAVLSRHPILTTRTWTDRVIGEHPPRYRGKPNRFAGQPLTFRRSPLLVEVALADSENPGELPEADRLTLLVVHAKTGDDSDAWRMAEGGAIAEILGELTADRPGRRVIVLGDFAVPDAEGHVAPLYGAGLADAYGAQTLGDPGLMATEIDGDRACYILLGSGVSLASGSRPFVLGTVVPPDRIDRRVGFRMPGFASDHYPLTVDLAR